MTRLEKPEDTIERLEEVIELYDGLEESADDFMVTQDASMKRTALKSVVKDIKRHELESDGE